MQIKRFSIVFGLAAVVAAAAFAAPARFGEAPRATATADFVLAQSVKEQQLEAVPPVDAGRTPSARTAPPPPPPVPPAPRASTRPAPPLSADDDAHPPARTGPPAPPAVPPAPRVTTRTAPPPAADDDSGPPAREVPPPPSSTSRVSPPRYQEIGRASCRERV